MHEWVETGISAILLALFIAVFIGFVVPNKVKERSARQAEVLKLRRLAEEEEERFGQQSTLEFTSMLLNSKKNCVICQNSATKLCSRCKAVRYCSQECQHQHWKQRHKYECQPVTVGSGRNSAKVSAEAVTPVQVAEPVPVPNVDEQKSPAAVESVPSLPEAASETVATILVEPPPEVAGELPTEAPAEAPVGAPAEAPAPAPDPIPAPAPVSPPAPAPEPDPALPPAPASAPPPVEAPIALPVAPPEIAPEARSSEAEELEAPAAAHPTPLDGKLPKPKKILFPYEAFVKFFNWDMLRLPPCGLVNCGNSCFANVVLQCLTYTRPLTAYLAEGVHGEDCRRNDWCFMCELQQHVCRVKQSQNPFSPIRILSRIRNIGNHLGYGRQEDAHEFMRFAIDSMQSICLDEFGGEKAVDTRTQETTLIHHIFGGHLQSQVKCMQCQHESNRYESMMDLAVEIQGFVESLEDALTQFTAPECLDGDNKYKCDRCNAYVQARKRLAIHEAPNVLTIALKRFQSGKFGKLNKRVTFPEVLDISSYMSGKGDNPPAYHLYAVVVHVDMLNASFFGHYICYVKNSLGSWYKIDDSKVKEVDLDKVLAQKAYMLFYSRSYARSAPTTDHDGRSSLAKIPTFGREGIAMANGNHANGPYSSRVHAFASKVPGVMPAITGLCAGNGSLQKVDEGHGISWIHDGLLVSSDLVSPWTEEVEMVSINADDSAEADSGYLDADYTVSVGERNEDMTEDLVACCHPSKVSSQQLLTPKAGKRRLDAGLSHLPALKGLDTDGLPSWPSAIHSRSSSCPSSLHAASHCLMSSSSLTRDACSIRHTESMEESENTPLDKGCNRNGSLPDAGGRGDVISVHAPEIFQVKSIARAKRQHTGLNPNCGQLSVSRNSESYDSTTDMEWADMKLNELEGRVGCSAPEVKDILGSKLLAESSLGVQVEGVEVSGSSACDLLPCQGGTTPAVSNRSLLHPFGSVLAGYEHKVNLEGENSAGLEEYVSSVGNHVSGLLHGEKATQKLEIPPQLPSEVQDTGLNLEPAVGSIGGSSSIGVARKSFTPQARTKLKPLISPGFLNKSRGLKIPLTVLASKRKTGEDDSTGHPETVDSNVLENAYVSVESAKQFGETALDINFGNGNSHPGLVPNGVLIGTPRKGRMVRSLRPGVNGNGRSVVSVIGAPPPPGAESQALPCKEISMNPPVEGMPSGSRVAAVRQKQGRNEICACGSQRKWKKCCGKANVMKVETRRVVV